MKLSPKHVELSRAYVLNHLYIALIGSSFTEIFYFLRRRWQVQRGVVCIPKSVTPSRIQQNLQVFDFSLSEGDLKLIESLNRNERFIVPAVVVSHPSRRLMKF